MKTNILTALALTSTVAFGAAALADSPFSAKSLNKGYQVAQATTTTPDKAKEASCGERVAVERAYERFGQVTFRTHEHGKCASAFVARGHGYSHFLV